ncbi:MAG: ROK family glucokinase [Clostridia bacterium]|nr:ROK family glucokinase [Clostridia bacterium]
MEISKLYPECKYAIWGGTRLLQKFNKSTSLTTVAESWELSFHKDGPTKLEDGRLLKDVASSIDLGKNCDGFPFFPVLVKLIDAKDDLSVQVHPSDTYALENENSFGKTETWYIVDADEGSGIYLGFKRDVSQEEYERAIANNTLTELLNFFEVKSGECYFIPSGTIHAIGKGCMICEIQQNSNLTYRVYDYGRKDKNGQTRELHVEKALKVTNLQKYVHAPMLLPSKQGDIIAINKYFTVRSIPVNGETTLPFDGNSFRAITCVKGNGYINEQKIQTGDSYFIPANANKSTLKGDMQIIMTEIRKYYVGIDLGGTFIKGGIVDDLGNILVSDKTPTESDKGGEQVVANIASLVNSLLEKARLTTEDVVGVGMGSPGMIDSQEGVVIYSNNLCWEHFNVADMLSLKVGLPVKVANDANVAALGEVKFGAAKAYNSAIMITLGTGVGGGIVVDGKLIEGNKGAGAELGHCVIVADGEPCTCGRKGCLEAYASATALIRETKRAMQANKNSKMWEIGSLDEVTGKTAFDYYDVDNDAKTVVDNYVKHLAFGLTNFANIFRPEVILLGGGVCAQGETLLRPVQAILDRDLFAGKKGPQVPVIIAELGNSAGLLGAAALLMD